MLELIGKSGKSIVLNEIANACEGHMTVFVYGNENLCLAKGVRILKFSPIKGEEIFLNNVLSYARLLSFDKDRYFVFYSNSYTEEEEALFKDFLRKIEETYDNIIGIWVHN